MIRLKANMLAVLLAAGCSLVAATAANAQTVRVTGGQVEGKTLPSGITAYMGIPFAAPPLGSLRWRPPQPVTPWKDVRQAKTSPPACMQKDAHEPISEDCLYLNVWTPKNARPGAKLPVMVYIYGGGFSAGSASAPTASGVGLAGKGIIFVAGNYRVGTFGFLAHPDLDKENAKGASGNYGMLDQVAVLKWTRANIARFGGDIGNVTLAGLSAGSVSTSAQHASAMGKGLFQKAMGISASSLTWEAGVFRSKADAEQDGLKVQAQLGGLSIAQMRALPADKILATRGGPPSIDGLFVSKDPKDIFAAGEQNDVPTFVGFTRDEGYGAMIAAKSVEEYRKAAHDLYGPADGDKLLAIYPADENWKRNAQLAARDITLGMAMRRWAAGQVGPVRKPSYVYLTATIHHFPASAPPAPDSRFVTAYHSSDNSFWLNDLDGFNDPQVMRSWTPQDYALADKMSDMTVAFMKTGNPSIPGITVPQYNPADEMLIGIRLADDYVIKPAPFPGRDHVEFLRSLKAIPRDRS
jgi:para-nitrobenzyl esterase